jgi:hypothetical protein
VGGLSGVSMLHDVIAPRLAPLVARFGFVLPDDSGAGANADNDVAHLEYRLEHAGSLVLLDLCHLAADRTVSASLWSPRDLARVAADAGADAVARDSDALAAEIVAEIATWLERAPWRRATG